MVKRKSIYVETLIRANIDQVWEYTQDPALHTAWDVRFSNIEYLPKAHANAPQRFLYQTRIGFGITIHGVGESVGTRTANSGERTSSLKFWTDQPISLIRKGAGYWKYESVAEGTRFLTQYDYKTRFGSIGTWFDFMVFRPLMGWATAWSFDCLRLWLEKEIHPSVSFRRCLLQYTFVAGAFIYWLFQGIGKGWGIAEIIFAMTVLFLWRSPAIWLLNMVMAALFPSAGSVLLIALACAALLNRRDLPDARNCRRAVGGAK